MKDQLILFITLLTTAQANLGTFDNQGRLLNPNTNQPFTGNLDVINQDWGKDAIEFNKDYVAGLQHGDEKVFYKTGQLKSVAKYIKGKVDGVAEFYYEDGTLKARVFMQDGHNEGRATSYYPNGLRSVEAFYLKGELQGLSRSWYEDGTGMTRGYYSNGVKNGLFTTYYENGKVVEEIKYEHGTPKYKRTYREDGTLADEQGFFDRKVIERIVG